MKWKFFAILMLLAAAAGAEFWALRERAEGVCLRAHELSRHAETVSEWVRQAAADPYLGDAALRGSPNSVIAFYLQEARSIVSEFSTRLLPEKPMIAFRELSLVRGNDNELISALRGLVPAVAGLECRTRIPDSPEGSELAKIVNAAGLFWAERRAVAVIEKQEFARDQVIFCKSEDLLKKLRRVVFMAKKACQLAVPGTKLAKGCGEGGRESTSSVNAEIQSLEQQEEFNLRKLRQKWPEAVVAGLRC